MGVKLHFFYQNTQEPEKDKMNGSCSLLPLTSVLDSVVLQTRGVAANPVKILLGSHEFGIYTKTEILPILTQHMNKPARNTVNTIHLPNCRTGSEMCLSHGAGTSQRSSLLLPLSSHD